MTEIIGIIIAAVLHELGHLIAIKLCGGRLCGFRLTFSGAEIDAELCELNRGKRAVVYSAGAVVNLISGFIGMLLGFESFSAASMSLGAINLLPVRLLDGGCLIHELIGHESIFLDILTAGIIFILWLLAMIMLIYSGSVSLWIFASYLFVEMYLRQHRIILSA